MRVTKTMTVTAFATLSVSVSMSPSKGYTGGSFTCSASWDTGAVGPFNLSINWGDGTYTDVTGHTSKSISRSHTYNSSGVRTVTVGVSDEYTAGSGSGSASVEVRSAVSASLSADKSSGDVPLAVNFTCAMSGGYAPYSWSLTYGDGGSDSGSRSSEGEVFPGHIYTKAGSYTVTLTVTDALGASAAAKSAIRAGALPIPSNLIIVALPLITGIILLKVGK